MPASRRRRGPSSLPRVAPGRRCVSPGSGRNPRTDYNLIRGVESTPWTHGTLVETILQALRPRCPLWWISVEEAARRDYLRGPLGRARGVACVGGGGIQEPRPRALRGGADQDREGRPLDAARPPAGDRQGGRRDQGTRHGGRRLRSCDRRL